MPTLCKGLIRLLILAEVGEGYIVHLVTSYRTGDTGVHWSEEKRVREIPHVFLPYVSKFEVFVTTLSEVMVR